jgi:hypothetical protein
MIPQEQIQDILDAHCRRAIDGMNYDALYNYALNQMKLSFDKNPGCGDTSLSVLMNDIKNAEGQDLDSVSEFLTGAGVEDKLIDDLMDIE